MLARLTADLGVAATGAYASSMCRRSGRCVVQLSRCSSGDYPDAHQACSFDWTNLTGVDATASRRLCDQPMAPHVSAGRIPSGIIDERQRSREHVSLTRSASEVAK